MAVRGIGDAYAFYRLLWMLVGMVVVPTLLLSLYGVVAIRNERAAIEQRVQQQQAQRLESLARLLADEIEARDARVRETAAGCGPSPEDCPGSLEGVSTLWVWPRGEERPAVIADVGLPRPEERVTRWFEPAQVDAPVGVFSTPAAWVAWTLDLDALESRITEQAQLNWPDQGTFQLRHQPRRTNNLLPDLESLAQGSAVQYQLLLHGPLANHELVVVFDRDDPVAAILSRNTWLYVGGMVLLMALVITGVVVTLRSMRRELALSKLQVDFVSNISHELKTPLTSIRMFVDTLQSGRVRGDPERMEECLSLLSGETDRLSRRISRVLDWARMEAGRRTFKIEKVSAVDIAKEAMDAFRSQFLLGELLGELDVEVEVEVPEDLPELYVDRDAIIEAVLNLLSNAYKYSQAPRQIRLTASVRGTLVGIAVSDNGRGIARQDKGRVFEKFYQVDNLLSRSTEGSGLGLAIVRTVVQNHGGSVTLESRLGQGSTFTLWLPTT